MKPVYKPETTLYNILIDGISRDFKNEQIIDEAKRSGYDIDDKLVNFCRDSFNRNMEESFEKQSGYGV